MLIATKTIIIACVILLLVSVVPSHSRYIFPDGRAKCRDSFCRAFCFWASCSSSLG